MLPIEVHAPMQSSRALFCLQGNGKMAGLAEKRSQETAKAFRMESLALFEEGKNWRLSEPAGSAEAGYLLGDFALVLESGRTANQSSSRFLFADRGKGL